MNEFGDDSLPIASIGVAMQCSICTTKMDSFGNVDFNRSGNDKFEGKRLFPVSTEMVHYQRCPECGFIGSTFFAAWTSKDYTERIYNAEYHLADPPYEDDRPRALSRYLINTLQDRDISFLDYGAGNGKLVNLLRDAGFTHVDAYDPFGTAQGSPPQGQSYDIITSIEVIEHVIDQQDLFEQILSLVKPGGLFLFSTLIQPVDIKEVGSEWWYICPRNGHTSFHTDTSLGYILANHGFRLHSLSEEMHIPACSKTSARFQYAARQQLLKEN
jgi:2-polyprenyl-3-methyl-5-hydroxy-6-metoxy-1,4-benzoquinol methylase